MTLIAEQFSAFADRLSFDDVPERVVNTAKYLMLDAIGIALASTTYDFAQETINALATFGAGKSPVIGSRVKLALRDAVLANGVLIHGLDFDDTHTVALIHATAGCFSTALGVAAETNASGRQLLTAYVLGMEIAARIGAVAKGEMNQIGFHPTGVIAAFACALIAGKLFGINQNQSVMAQGIVLSMASGNREYSFDASGTKRLHPGWAGVAGITAAVLAKGGFTGPRTAYEGRFGLYATHLPVGSKPDLGLATAKLGATWETLQVSVKPYPVGHFNVAFIDAAIALSGKHGIVPEDVAAIEALVPRHAVNIVCEPAELRKRPANSYAAKFSVQYAIACALVAKKFGLAELERYGDPAILALADKVTHSIDLATGYPRHMSGEVIITMKSGERFSHREQVNRGAPDNPLSEIDILEKFMNNAALALPKPRAEEIADTILSMDKPQCNARELAAKCALVSQ
jgi:2-methylcitrate dehydratase PrpD